MSETNKTAASSIGVSELLGVAFVVLKLTHVIDWPWWLVTAPFWAWLALGLGLLAVYVVGYIAVAIYRDLHRPSRRPR